MVQHDKTATVQSVKLTKRYGSSRGIEDIDMSIYPGEVYGFLGPNGAGKTTTIRCLLDLLRPTSGAAYLFGEKVQGNTSYLRANVGYVAGEVRLPANLTGEELIRLNEGLHARKAPHVKTITDNFEIELKRKVRTLSKGNKQKLALLLAFMFDNELYILDEPTSGLDPLKQQYVFQLIEERRAHGASVMLSSHILSEVQQASDRVGVISAGRLLAQEDMQSLINRQQRYVTLRFVDGQQIDNEFWNHLPGITKPQWQDAKTFKANLQPAFLNSFVQAMATSDLEDIEIEKVSLEEIFLDYYQVSQSDQESSEAQLASIAADLANAAGEASVAEGRKQ